MTAQHPLLRASGLLLHYFGRAPIKWQRQQNGTWKSTGGRVLSDASYQKMQARLKAAPGAAPEPAAAKPSAAKPAGKPAKPSGAVDSIKSIYDRAAGASDADIEAANRTVTAMSKPDLLKAAAAIGHAPAAGASRADLAKAVLARISDRRGAAVRAKLNDRPPPVDHAAAIATARAGQAKAEAAWKAEIDPDRKDELFITYRAHNAEVLKAEAAAKAAGTPFPKPSGAKTPAAPSPAPTPPPGTVKNVYGQNVPDTDKEPPPAPVAPGLKKTAGGAVINLNRPAPIGPALDGKIRALSALPAPKPPPAPPPKPPKLPEGMPPVPPPKPDDMAWIDDTAKKDTKRFGARAAEFLRGALSYAVGMLTFGNGLAWGALAGAALGGPLGLALGTVVGSAVTGKLAGVAARKTYSVLGGAGRARVMARKAARTVLPKVAAAGVGVPLGVGAAAATLGANIGGQALGSPVGTALGIAGGASLGVRGGQIAGDLSTGAAKMVREKLARSTAAKRVAARTNKQKLFSERFADVPASAPPDLDPVALLKARLAAVFARRGEPGKAVDDKVIMSALAMAALAADQAETGGAAPAPPAPAGPTAEMADACRTLVDTSKKVRAFGGRSGPAPFVPSYQKKGAGLLPFA